METKAFETNPQWAGCYCQFYLNSPPENENQELNRDRACDRISNGTMKGYLAIDNGEVIGWMSATRANDVKQLPPASEQTARILCFVIEPQHQNQGIATALLNFAIEDLKTQGFELIEAAPLQTDQHRKDAYRGKLSMFKKAGFEEVTMIDDQHILVHRNLSA